MHPSTKRATGITILLGVGIALVAWWYATHPCVEYRRWIYMANRCVESGYHNGRSDCIRWEKHPVEKSECIRRK